MSTAPYVTQPDQVGNLFVEAYESRLTHEFQQTQSKLAATVDQGGVFIGDKMYSPMMGAVVAQDLVRFQEITVAAGEHRMVEVDCQARIAALPVADVDRNKMTVSLAPHYAESTVRAINRDLDRVIYQALLAEANRAGTEILTIGNYNDDINLELLLTAIATLEDAEAVDDSGGMITLVLPAIPKNVLAGTLALALRVANEAGLSASKLKFLDPLDDVQMVRYGGCSRITTAPSGHPALGSGVVGTDLFMYVKGAVTARANDDPRPVKERLPLIMSDMIGTWCQTGAVVKQGLGVIRIRCRRNSVIKITPLPTKEVA